MEMSQREQTDKLKELNKKVVQDYIKQDDFSRLEKTVRGLPTR
jgi:hypothetical protein